MSSSTPDPAALRLAELAEEVLALSQQLLARDDSRAIPEQAVQQLLTAGTRLFARKTDVEARNFPPVTSPSAVMPTDIAVVVTEMMRVVDLNLFDLSMWAARPRYDDTTHSDARGLDAAPQARRAP